ncbi:glycosyltransferase family 4 protein [soil metagenome]
MRIQLFCAAFPPFGKGGGPATSELIARALVESGHVVEVITATDAPYEDLSRPYRVLSIGSPNIYADYWQERPSWKKMIWHVTENFNPIAYFRTRRVMRAFKPDLVGTISIENVNVATWLAAKHQKVPVVHFLHSYFLYCWKGSLYKNDKNCTTRCGSCKLLSVGKRASAVNVQAVVGETHFIIDQHVRDGLFADIPKFVIPSPMNDNFHPVPAIPRQGRIGEKLSIGYIGNISPEKGVFTLADAAMRLEASHPGVFTFKVGGTGKDVVVDELKARFPVGTEFLGWCKPNDFYAKVDVVVVPSRWSEPFGRVSIEPLEHGIPVIVARSGGLPENVDDGVSGMVFEPGDDAGLARALAQLADSPGMLERLAQGAARQAGHYSFPGFITALDKMVKAVSALKPRA